ncbi:STN domain-containing protein [Pseudomonas sp.]|uniref:STN domain-containing protein n=1 Tax=Pseudomonas sp. TaxID=306 RepID=UPI003C5C0C33
MNHTFHRLPGQRGPWPLRLKKTAGAGLLGFCCAFGAVPQALSQAQAADNTAHGFSIAPQPLAGALIAFGQQSGQQVTVDPQLLKGVSSPGVNGDMSNDAALAYLLQGTGIGWAYQDGALVFHRLASADAGPLMLDNTVVLGFTEENSFQGATVIDQRAIQAFPGANGDITTLLQMHPAVQFSGEQKSSNTPGEIDPADISINGAKFYQNNFMIDGMSINKQRHRPQRSRLRRNPPVRRRAEPLPRHRPGRRPAAGSEGLR